MISDISRHIKRVFKFENNQPMMFCRLCLCFLLTFPVLSHAGLKNQLQHHASPYLAMHGNDPVAWQDWGEAAVNQAKQENKLLFISSGYFSCHWCHVMQRESYKNNDIAKLLNTYFIPVKVDRELNPALDARLIDFVERTQGIAGWPLNAFVTPDGYPLVGMVYVPQPQFKDVLEKITEQWKFEQKNLTTIAMQATVELLSSQVASNPQLVNKKTIDKLAPAMLQQAATVWDDMAGGLGDQNKFPNVPLLQGLLSQYQINNDKKIKTFLIATLDNMATQGLWDHVAGGFFRYTVDPNWQIPHFEKMLYDNALLASLYFRAGKVFSRQDYIVTGEHTLRFMKNGMQSDVAILAASLSAVDDKGIEGGSYLWQYDDLKKFLSAQDYKIANLYWKLVTNEDLNNGYHLVQGKSVKDIAQALKLTEQDVLKRVQSAQQTLMHLRSKRSLPKDDKPVTAWLGLALQAYVDGYAVTKKPDYKNMAALLTKTIKDKLWLKNELYRSVKADKDELVAIGNAGLEDYAYTAAAVYSYAKIADDKNSMQFAKALTLQAWQRFYVDNHWSLTENPLLKYDIGKAVLTDDVLPSPSAILIDLTFKIHAQNKAFAPYQQALFALKQGQEEILSSPFWHASHISLLQTYKNKFQKK